MAKYFTELNIKAFRGIKELNITDLDDVNIIIGDNNSGKTSFLEAVQIISDPVEYTFFRVAGFRCNPVGKMNVDSIDAAISVMQKAIDGINERYILEILAVSTKVNKHQYQIIIDNDELENYKRYIKATAEFISILSNSNESLLLDFDISSSSDIKNDTLLGSMSGTSVNNKDHIEFIKGFQRPLNYEPDINVGALYAVDHVITDNYKKIINNKSQTKKALNLLKDFNENINDIRYLNKNGIPVPVIDTDTREAAPLSDYGDGLKKALAMMEAVLRAENGILLIDEYESAIHPSVMNSVYSFILKACKELNIQLFMTTHSIEALDNLLDCDEAELDKIRIITLKKKSGKTHSRILNGQEAWQLRINNDAELR